MRLPDSVLILGAGPAGLMCAHRLTSLGVPVKILELEAEPGGMCRTARFSTPWGEFRFDYGGHRFITGNRGLLKLVESVMGEDLLRVHRSSVIRFQGRTYQYPLNLANLWQNAPKRLLFGVARDVLYPSKTENPEASFESWMVHHFGRTLYEEFFHDYTQKLWGIPPRQLSADWAAQRISLLNLKDILRRLVNFRKDRLRTYAAEYRYPKWGMGQLFSRLAEVVQDQGGTIHYQQRVVGMERDGNRIQSVHTAEGTAWKAAEIISTLPINDLGKMLQFDTGLKFRGLRFYDQPLDQDQITSHTWQYLSDADQPATRLQEPKRRSPWMASEGKTSAMLEVPVDEDAETVDPNRFFQTQKGALKALNVDLDRALGPAFSKEAPYAYPLLEVGYQKSLQRTRDFLRPIQNLTLCGRQACFRYAFMDTAMEMGLKAADRILNLGGDQDEIFLHRNQPQMIETQSVA